MKIRELIDICNRAIPREVEYMEGEPYGPYNITDSMMEADVSKVLYCVTPTPAVVKLFKDGGYDLLVSHHPYVQRVPHLVYHTALDCCEGGLNDLWRDALGVKNAKHFDKDLGWYGEIDPIPFDELVEKVREFCGGVKGQKYVNPKSDKIIRSVVICTGLGGLVNNKAATTKADCYILGEACDRADKMGFKAVIETGHTLSEWIGVKVFRKLLEPHGIVVDQAPFEADVFGTEVFKIFGNRKSYGGYQL